MKALSDYTLNELHDTKDPDMKSDHVPVVRLGPYNKKTNTPSGSGIYCRADVADALRNLWIETSGAPPDDIELRAIPVDYILLDAPGMGLMNDTRVKVTVKGVLYAVMRVQLVNVLASLQDPRRLVRHHLGGVAYGEMAGPHSSALVATADAPALVKVLKHHEAEANEAKAALYADLKGAPNVHIVPGPASDAKTG